MAVKKTVFTGKEKEYYDALMAVRSIVTSQMQFHAEDALDCSNADRRGVTTHMADTSIDNARHEMALKLMTEDGDVVQLIEEALQRLSDGEYGKCQECGQPIPEGRLKIRPYAVYCVKCKEKHERQMSQE